MNTALHTAIERTGEIVLGKQTAIRQAITCLLAGGHLLIEDVPGVGKTILAQTLARTLGLEFQRIQFTSDLMPGDIIGTSVYNRADSSFRFYAGPIFSQLVLADEVNRATPKTQSALLEAMEEQQVTIDGESRPLPNPFFVIATQNPVHQLGTFPLPESQLDRFLMRISLGYPDAGAERQLLQGTDRRELLRDLPAALDADRLLELRREASRIHVADALIDYVQALLRHTRDSGQYRLGLSPRAGLALLGAARAWALLDDRSSVLPEDIQAVLEPVVGHRLQATLPDHENGATTAAGVPELLAAVPVP